MAGVLYVCATPIGNLDDVTLRLLATLRSVDLVLAEDTRYTHKLLARHEISAPLGSCHQHSHPAKIEALAARLEAGETFALVTDAGTPGISDPGSPLVAAAAAHGVSVQPIPGPCALVAALSVCGFNVQQFSFLGFLPRKPGRRRRALSEALARGETVALYESPHRVAATLRDLAAMEPGRATCACRELTKKFEETRRGTLAELATYFGGQKEVRGEFVLVISGQATETVDEFGEEPGDEEVA
jgi:16S rRNA (cytidine1402-2'-O)-methyltransferase